MKIQSLVLASAAALAFSALLLQLTGLLAAVLVRSKMTTLISH